MRPVLVVGLPAPMEAELRAQLRDLAPDSAITTASALTAAVSEGAQLVVAGPEALRAADADTAWPPVLLVAPAECETELQELASRWQAVTAWLAESAGPARAGRLRLACQAGLRRGALTAVAQDRQRLLQVQQAIIRGAASGADLAAILQLAAGLIQKRLEFERVAVYLREPDANDLALCAVAGREQVPIPAAAYHLPLGEGAAGQCVAANAVIQLRRALPAETLEFAYPIRAEGRVLGALTVEAGPPGRLSAERVDALSALADQLATLVLSLESARRESERAGRERLLTHISHVANSWLNPAEMLYQAITAAARSLHADRSALSVFDWDEGVFVTEHEHTNPLLTERRSLRRRAPLAGGLAQAAEALRAGEILVATEGAVPPVLQDYWTWLVDRHGIRSLIWVPIPGEAAGRLHTFSLMQVTQARAWGAADVALLSGVADQLALALRNAELFDGMRAAAAQLEAKNSELEAFVYTVSHDLQAPVVSMRGFASLLQSRYQAALDERGRAYLGRIAANADYLGHLLQDLLELSRVGRQEEPDENVVVQGVLDEVLLDLAQTFAERGITLDLPAEWPVVWYSRLRLRQIFSNMLTNAAKFMGPQTQPQIEIGWRAGPIAAPAPAVPGGFIEFFVRDNGIGIHPDYHQRIFVPFERLKQVEVAGTGVGLSIVKRIVEGRGGRIRLESQPGAGATFYFTLPAMRQTAALAADGEADL